MKSQTCVYRTHELAFVLLENRPVAQSSSIWFHVMLLVADFFLFKCIHMCTLHIGETVVTLNASFFLTFKMKWTIHETLMILFEMNLHARCRYSVMCIFWQFTQGFVFFLFLHISHRIVISIKLSVSGARIRHM